MKGLLSENWIDSIVMLDLNSRSNGFQVSEYTHGLCFWHKGLQAALQSKVFQAARFVIVYILRDMQLLILLIRKVEMIKKILLKGDNIIEILTFRTPLMIILILVFFAILLWRFSDNADLLIYDTYEVTVEIAGSDLVISTSDFLIDQLPKEIDVFSSYNEQKVGLAKLFGSYYIIDNSSNEICYGDKVKINVNVRTEKLWEYLLK